MQKWSVASTTRSNLGTFTCVVHAPNQPPVDVTTFRGAPTSIDSWAFADPFGDSTAVISFPQITPMDEINVGVGELAWLQDFADVDIFLLPPGAPADPTHGPDLRTKVWEGFITSMEWTLDDSGPKLSLQCQGALFQVDRYVQGPEYSPRPIPYEVLIARAFDLGRRPNLRTRPLVISFPAGWTKTAPGLSTQGTAYDMVGITPGQNWTGYSARNVAAWDRSLTSYVQNMLGVMWTDDTQDQWTIRKDPGRQPVLYVRQHGAAANYTLYAGQPGVEIQLTRDLTQYANVMYASGTDISGAEYSGMSISNDGNTTEYVPFAYDPRLFPTVNNAWFNRGLMRSETYTRFDNGFDERQAFAASKEILKRDMDPGLAGTITLSVDPPEGSRYLMKAGQIIRMKWLIGTGEMGISLFVSQCQVNLAEGRVTLTVDSRFRDALTLEESLARTRDALTPVKLLQVGKQQLMIPDQLAPWDYSKGSGFMPQSSTGLYNNVAVGEVFPFPTQSVKYPPARYGGFYVPVFANSSNRRNRWTIISVRMAEKGDIRLTQVSCHDRAGNILPIKFHVSAYTNPVTPDDMPYDANGPSPFIPNAFQKTDPYGMAPGGQTTWQGDESLIIGWGDGVQPAGFSPGSYSQGDKPTGLLIDESSWSFDCTAHILQGEGVTPAMAQQDPSTFSITVAFYAEYHDVVFFRGRFYRKDPGY